jgi:RNA polymerase sigma-70 factor (ECF subfamily)
MASIDAIEGEDDRESELALIPSTELDPAIKTELKHDLEQAMQILKPIDRSIVYLYVVEEFTMEEIGESLGISESAAKVRAHRSYKKLRDALDQKKKGNAR